MEKEKIEYLKQSVGFHFEDLTTARKIDFKMRPESFEWKLVALSEGSLRDWNEKGFKGLWSQKQFIDRVDARLKRIKEMPLEDFIPESPKTSSIGKGKELTMDTATLSRYPRNVWFWCDEDHVKSKNTGKIFKVIGGKKLWDELYEGKDNYCDYYWDGKQWSIKETSYKYDHKSGTYKKRKPEPVLSIEWHRLNKFRKINEVYESAREVYDEWVKLGLIPADKQIGAPAISEKKKNGFLLD